MDVLERHIAAEARTDSTHARKAQIVAGAVRGAEIARVRIVWWRRRGLFERRLLGVVQVLRPQLVSHLDEPAHREQPRQLVPRSLLEQGLDASGQMFRSVRHGSLQGRV
jgi:hypothetical protein